MIYSTKYSINIHCCCKKTKFSGCQLYSGLPPMICKYTTSYLISYSKGLLDASSLFGQSYKWCTHVHMKQQSQNRDLQPKIAKSPKLLNLEHFRAFQEKKIGVEPQGYSWGTRTRGYVVLGNHEKYFSMPIEALNPQN